MIKTREITPAELEERISILEAALAEPGRVPQEYHGQIRQVCAMLRHPQGQITEVSMETRSHGT